MPANYQAEVVGVFGQPVAENPTGVMQEAGFAAAGLNWRYLNFEVPPEKLGAAMDAVDALGMRGINLTIPHKVAVIEYLDELAPEEGDVVITKSRGSAFYQTPLDSILKARGIGTVLLTGVLSAGCVLFTAADAMHHGYYPLVVRDCVASYSLEAHRQALNWMETQFPVFDLGTVLVSGRGRNGRVESAAIAGFLVRS